MRPLTLPFTLPALAGALFLSSACAGTAPTPSPAAARTERVERLADSVPVIDAYRWWLAPAETIATRLTDPRVFVLGDTLLVADWAKGAFTLRDGHRTDLAAPWDKQLNLWSTPLVLDGLMMGTRDVGRLAAVEVPSLKVRWETQLEPDHFNGLYKKVGDTLVVVPPYQNRHQRELVVLDANTGAIRWRREVGKPIKGMMSVWDAFAVTPEAVIANDSEGGRPSLVAWRAVTGDLIWRVPLEKSTSLLLADADIVITSLDGKTRAVLDAKTGQLQKALGGGLPRGLVLDDKVLYLVNGVASAYDVGQDRELWSHAIQPAQRDDPPLLLTAHEVVICQDRTFHVFDRRNGTELWSYGLPELSGHGERCPTFAVAPGPVLYAAEPSGELVVYRPTRTPAEAATVSGVVTDGSGPVKARVWVGTDETKTDPSGHYTLRTTSRGSLRVHAEQSDVEENCSPLRGMGEEALVPLTGAGAYSVNLQVGVACSADESDLH